VAPPSVVHAYTGSAAGAGGTCTINFPSTPSTGGHQFAVIVQMYSVTTITGLGVSSVTLGGSADHFARAFSQVISAGTWVNEVWLDPGCASGATSITVTLAAANSTTQVNVFAYELSGVAAGYPLDVLTSGFSLASATAWAAPTFANTQPGVLWIGAFTGQGSTAPVAGPGSPWSVNGTSTVSNTAGGAPTLMACYTNPVTGAAGTMPFSGTTSSVGQSAVLLMAIPSVATGTPISWSVADPASGAPGQSGVWCAPPTVTSIFCAGTAAGAGAGGAPSTAGHSGGGAGAGEYAAEPGLGVTPGGIYPWATAKAGPGGTGSAGVNGGNTTFAGDTVTVTANGGQAGGFSSTGLGAGGQGGTGSANTIHFDGGAGAPGTSAAGGGGGSSAGPASSGNNATTSAGATAVTGGGPGASGATVANTAGSSPASGPGGAGGGVRQGGSSAAGHGWSGALQLAYSPSRTPGMIRIDPQAARRASYW